MSKANEQQGTSASDKDQAIEAQVKAFVKKNEGLLASLYGRWQDEKEYEDINDYGARIAKEFPEGWKLLSTSKRPFGVKIDTGTVVYKITVNSRSISWQTGAK